MKWKYLAAWLPGIAIAVANGALREFGYRLFSDELQAHQLSAVSFVVLFGLYVFLVLPWLRISKTRDAISLGVTWLLLTIAFEFVFGHFVMGHPWDRLLHDYNISEGRVWVLVLAWVTFAPFFVLRLRKQLSA